MIFFDQCANQEWLVEQNIPSFHKEYLKRLQANSKEEISYLTNLLQANQLFEKEPSELENETPSLRIRDLWAGYCL